MRCTLPKSTFTGKAVAARSAAPAQAKAAFVVTAKKAGEWLPGKASPAWLDGSLPGDYGFDPLNLGSNPENLAWYAQAEIQHCRWAMLGTAGILLPDLAAKAGVSWAGAGVPWYEAGKFAYFAPPAGLLAAQVSLSQAGRFCPRPPALMRDFGEGGQVCGCGGMCPRRVFLTSGRAACPV